MLNRTWLDKEKLLEIAQSDGEVTLTSEQVELLFEENAKLVKALAELPTKIMDIQSFADTEELTFPLLDPSEEDQNEWLDWFLEALEGHIKNVVEDVLSELRGGTQ